MIQIWTKGKSIGASLLVNEINNLGANAERVVGGSPPHGALCWGGMGGNKYEELERLAAVGVPVPPHSRTPKAGWLARRDRHREANDLLAELSVGDYYVEFVPTLHEHRIHVFNGHSIRVSMKVPRIEDPNPRFRSWAAGWKFEVNPANTRLLPKGAREYAATAVKALGYEFGAVDIATTVEGQAIIWEVNSQPGIEGSTVRQYAAAVIRKFKEEGSL